MIDDSDETEPPSARSRLEELLVRREDHPGVVWLAL
jgi:hypothetical protein